MSSGYRVLLPGTPVLTGEAEVVLGLHRDRPAAHTADQHRHYYLRVVCADLGGRPLRLGVVGSAGLVAAFSGSGSGRGLP